MTGLLAARKRLKALGIVAALGLTAAVALGGAGLTMVSDYRSLPPPPEASGLPVSAVVLDRNGLLLRAFTSSDDKWRLPVDLEKIDPLYFKLLLAYEDKRFRSHKGVDPLALARAGWQGLTTGRVVSGGSTLTMQTARLLDETPTKSLRRKYLQILKAVQLEQRFTKDEILHLYALRAPFGGNLEGIRAASLTWFGKEPGRLTPAEAALLVALPQNPEGRRPDRHLNKALSARNRVLARAASAGVLTQEEAASAAAEPLRAERHRLPFSAVHAARTAMAAAPHKTEHHLTIDRGLQQSLEELVHRRAAAYPAPVTMAMVVADHQTGDILASIGAPDLLDEARYGHVDMTHAIRSPGSTLKPFIYALAFEERIGLPDSLIVDRPVDIGGYKPTNFDTGYQGTITLREALQLSLNTPAVQLLEAVGPARLLARLKRAGARPELDKRTAPGLAVGLGGLGLSLADLTKAYAALARGGRPLALTSCRINCAKANENAPAALDVVSSTSAAQVTEILSGLPQPSTAGDGQIAYKTGTTYGYRDAWAVGFDGRTVVGVWVGRPDGSPVPGLTGASAAVPVLFESFQKLGARRAPLNILEAERLPEVAQAVPDPLRYARVRDRPSAGEPGSSLSITYPPDGAEVDLGLATSRNEQPPRSPLFVKVSGGRQPYAFLVDGAAVGTGKRDRTLVWAPEHPGFVRVTVLDAAGASDTVLVRIR